jgi:membrane associated rhomboid family serine protease
MRNWTATQWLIAINIVVFIADLLSNGMLTFYGRFLIDAAIYHLQIWRFITFQFLHAGTAHILFNMVGLACFGPLIEPMLGKRKFVLFYLICGCGGAILLYLFGLKGIRFVVPGTWLVGASAGIFGIMAAAARRTPNSIVYIWLVILPTIPVRVVVIVGIYFAIAVLAVVSAGSNAGGEASHIGGAVLGFFLIDWFLRKRLKPKTKSQFWRPGDPTSPFVRDEFRK